MACRSVRYLENRLHAYRQLEVPTTMAQVGEFFDSPYRPRTSDQQRFVADQ
jgi:hypothetical protein